MPPSSIEVHPEALAEAKAAYDWYFERSPAAATAFIVELDATIGAIGEAPQRCALYLARTRRYVLRRFPYAVNEARIFRFWPSPTRGAGRATGASD